MLDGWHEYRSKCVLTGTNSSDRTDKNFATPDIYKLTLVSFHLTFKNGKQKFMECFARRKRDMLMCLFFKLSCKCFCHFYVLKGYPITHCKKIKNRFIPAQIGKPFYFKCRHLFCQTYHFFQTFVLLVHPRKSLFWKMHVSRLTINFKSDYAQNKTDTKILSETKFVSIDLWMNLKVRLSIFRFVQKLTTFLWTWQHTVLKTRNSGPRGQLLFVDLIPGHICVFQMQILQNYLNYAIPSLRQ